MKSSDISILNLTDDQKISLLVASLWGYYVIIRFINEIVNLVFPNTPVDTAICYAIILAIIVLSLRPILLRMKADDYFFLIMFILAFLLSALFFQPNYYRIGETWPRFFFTVFPFFFIGRALQDYNMLLNYLRSISKWMILSAIGYYLIIVSSGIGIGSYAYDMDYAYKLLPGVLVMLFFSLSEYRVLDWLFVLMGLIGIFLAGTRGPILCIAAFLTIYLIINIGKTKAIFRFIPVIFIGGFIAFSSVFTQWADKLNQYLANIGVYNRIFDKLLNGGLYESYGRDVIREAVIAAIQTHPFRGYGIMGDRIIILNSEYDAATYSHNLILEVLCQYGVVLGSLLLIALFITVLNKLVKAKDLYERVFVVMLICLGIVKLMLSGSYLYEPYLFLLIGVCIGNRKIARNP